MVKVVYENNNFNDIFNGTAQLDISGNQQTATYADGLTTGRLILQGSGFERDGGSQYLSGGTIHELSVIDENSDLVFKLTDLDIKAEDLPHNYITGDFEGPNGLFSELFRGRDRVVGSEITDYLHGYGRADRINGRQGNDDIYGEGGDDILKGGEGSDTFHFFPAQDGVGHDVIKDFDVVGPTVDHLHIDPLEHPGVQSVHNGDDTLLTLNNGSTILLENVRLDDLMDYWQS